MKAIVTGGVGFIGSHLVERLLADGHAVTVLDNFSTGNRDNIKPFLKRKSFRLVTVDIADEQVNLEKYIKGSDWLFHLAALADIVPSIIHPLAYYNANVTGTVRILKAARNVEVHRFLYAASTSCYGIPNKFPTSETSSIQPQYPYALTKWMGEQYVIHWGKVYNLPVVSLRLFNVYGPRSRTSGTYGAVFGIFLAQKLAGKPFTLVGDGTQTRDFTFVTDVVEAFITAARSNVCGEIFNVGTGNPQSVNTLVKLLGGEVVYIPKRPGEPNSTHADITKIKKILGWKPKVSFDQGVREVLKYINYWKKAPVWTPKTIEIATRDWFTYLGRQQKR